MREEKTVQKQEEQLVVFQLGNETYGVDIAIVREIIRMQSITPVPRTPDFVEGVINLRGKVIPVIDLHKRFELPCGDETNDTRIIVVEVGEITVGMIVDSVSEVLRIASESIDPPPHVISSGVNTAYLRGVGKLEDRLIILLDLQKILHKEEHKELEESMKQVVATEEE